MTWRHDIALCALLIGPTAVVNAPTARALPTGQILTVRGPSSPIYDCADEKLVVIDLADSSSRTLSDCAYDARLSPSGHRIVFARHLATFEFSHILVMRADGTARRRLTRGGSFDASPAFFPGGHRIVFSRSSRDGRHLYVVGMNGRGLARLPHTAGAERPVVSPDGRTIAFDRPLDPKSSATSVFAIDADGTGLRRLARGGAPDFSPDGRKIVYSRGWYEGDTFPYVMDADGTRKRRLSARPSEGRPMFSPRGGYVAYARHFYTPWGGSYDESRSEIFAVRASGTAERKLTDNPWGKTTLVTDWGASQM